MQTITSIRAVLATSGLTLLSAAATMLPAAVAQAQGGAPSGRGSVGVHFQVAEPKGDFGENTKTGYGLGGNLIIGIDKDHIFNWRVDGSFLTYANSNRNIPLSGTGGLIQLKLRTSSNIASLVTGPQLLGPTGRFTPYASALGGFSVFWTESTVEGSQNVNTPFASTTNSSDAVWAYGGAVGAYLRVYNGKNPVRLDIGARMLRHDDVRYLNDQRVREAFENDRPAVPVRGRADFITYYAGVNIITW